MTVEPVVCPSCSLCRSSAQYAVYEEAEIERKSKYRERSNTWTQSPCLGRPDPQCGLPKPAQMLCWLLLMELLLLLSMTGDGCRSRSFTPDRSTARCIDWQKLRLQELLGADQQQQGKVPRSVEVSWAGLAAFNPTLVSCAAWPLVGSLLLHVLPCLVTWAGRHTVQVSGFCAVS